VHFVQQSLPHVSIDVAQMEQVLMNIFLNALQAMPDGGILSVSCQILHTPDVARSGRGSYSWVQLPRQVEEVDSTCAAETAQGARNQQAWLELAISDTGVGIAQDALERIFQPFYTTKAHGIGLGLPIARRLIEDHHGSILVESQLGYGTTVSIRLPLRDEPRNGPMNELEDENEKTDRMRRV
jgi:signal transduction histidine kinase